MRYYKLNNQYYSYNDLHNTYGYTYTPTGSVAYLLVSPWGDNTQTINGYSVPTDVYSESSYFVENSIGWFTLNQLSVNAGYFPSNVENTTLTRNGETSNVVFLSFADEPRYLIEKDLSSGWITEQEYIQRGWGKGTGIILIDKTQDEETFIASLPEVEFLTKDEHIPDIDKSLLELPIVPQIEFITKDVHIPSINKTLLEIPVTTFIDFIVKDKHIPDINKTLLEIPVPTSIDLINKSNLPDVTAYDIAYGVISSVQLPTFNDGKYINTSFGSLRYYVKGTLSNTGMTNVAFGHNASWYYGTITWNDPSLGDLSDKILTSNPNGGQADLNTRQTVFRIIFITDGNITGYHPYDTGDAGITYMQITAYTYTNGIHSITFYMTDQDWASGVYAGRIQFRYLDGTTTFNNLDAFDLVNVSNGTISKETTTDRYDMYSVWGGNITIKVGSTAYTGYTRQDKQPASVSGNAWTKLFDENGNYIDYDSTKTYVITSYYVNTISYGNNGDFVIGQSDGKLSVKYYRTGFSGSATWFTYTVS